MEVARYLTLLVVMALDTGVADGHKKHHSHLKIHVPDFIHHDFHTKVITIHHHHHKPKKTHHHHHHHHHSKPKHHVPHHVYHHKKKTVKKTSTHKKTHGHPGHHKHHGHHHKHHGHHHKHHGHHHKHHGHHHHDLYPYPEISYDPPAPTYGYIPETYGDSLEIPPPPPFSDHGPKVPKVHGFTHTVKQLQVFDSNPNDIPGLAASGYQVTEESGEEDDPFNSVNSLQHSYPGTVDFVKGLAPEGQAHEPFGSLPVQSTVPTVFSSPIQSSAQPPAEFGIETFTAAEAVEQHQPQQYAVATVAAEPQSRAAPPATSPEFPSAFDAEDDGGIDDAETFSAPLSGGNSAAAYFSDDDDHSAPEGPSSFSRSAGIHQAYHTADLQSIVY